MSFIESLFPSACRIKILRLRGEGSGPGWYREPEEEKKDPFFPNIRNPIPQKV